MTFVYIYTNNAGFMLCKNELSSSTKTVTQHKNNNSSSSSNNNKTSIHVLGMHLRTLTLYDKHKLLIKTA